MKNTVYVRAVWQWSWQILVRAVLILLGLVVVAIAIPLRVDSVSVSDGRYISNLPSWAWLWGNDHDGLLGDKRFWWRDNTPFGVKVDSFLAMYWWTAIRNPVNNMRHLEWASAPIIGSTINYVGDYVVEDRPNEGGWHFTETINGKRTYYGFHAVWEWKGWLRKLTKYDRGFVLRLGFKVKPEHRGQDEPRKGLTFRCIPWKKL